MKSSAVKCYGMLGTCKNHLRGGFSTMSDSQIKNHTIQYTCTMNHISFVITTLCDLDGQLSSQQGFTFSVCYPC